MAADCLFCKIIAGDVPSTKVYEDEEMLAFRDIAPVTPTHILLVPKEHISTVCDAQPEHAALLGRMLLKASDIARQEQIDSSGFRLVINTGDDSGRTIMHLHLHILGGRPMRLAPG